ncbi:MAG: hypothetical protein JXR70_14445 [Spirochaetales bacterium]|nr:hypothetical protein [Spirochaetales bacterium]
MVLTFGLFGQNYLPSDLDSFMYHYRTALEFYPNLEGSEQEEKLLIWLKAELDKIGVSYREIPYSASYQYYSFSKTLEVVVPADSERTLLFAVPLNHGYFQTQEQSGAFNIAFMLSLIQGLNSRKADVSCRFLFLSAEKGESMEYPFGGKYYLDTQFQRQDPVLIYMDFPAPPQKIVIKTGAKGLSTPYWLINKVLEIFKKADLDFEIPENEIQLNRMNLLEGNLPITPFMEMDIPSVYLTSKGQVTEQKDIFNLNFTLFNIFTQFFSSYKDHWPETWDSHYIFFRFQDLYLLIAEPVILAIAIGTIIFGILVAFVFSRKLLVNVKRFFHYFWTPLLVILLTYVFFLISSFVLWGVQEIKENDQLWRNYTLVFYFFKFVFPLFLYLFFHRLVLKRFIFPAKSNLYLFLGVFLLLFVVLIFSSINLAFVIYPLWALFLIIISIIIPKRSVRLVAVLLSPVLIIKFIIDHSFAGNFSFMNLLLFKPFQGDILLTILIVPFVFLALHIFYLFIHSRNFHILVNFVSKIFFSLSVIYLFFAFIYIFLGNPFSLQNKQDIELRYIIDQKAGKSLITFKSDFPIGRITMENRQQAFSFDSITKEYIIPQREIPRLLSWNISYDAFLDRKNVILNLEPEALPYKMILQITQNNMEDFILYDSNFPSQRFLAGKYYELYVGSNPPSPFPLELTLPGGGQFTLQIELNYIRFPFPFYVSGKYKNIRSRLVLTDEIPVDTR